MIEPMKFLSVTGPKEDIDRMVETYLSKYEFQIEDALAELKDTHRVEPYTQENPYRTSLTEVRAVIKEYGNVLAKAGGSAAVKTKEEAAKIVSDLNAELSEKMQEKTKRKTELEKLKESYDKIVPFIGLNYNVQEVLHFDNISYSFGRMPVEYYQKFLDYTYDDVDTIIHECSRDQNFAYLVYFVPRPEEDRINAIFSTMYFEKIFIPDEYTGTPAEEINRLHELMKQNQEQIFALDMQIADYLDQNGAAILAAEKKLSEYATYFDIRKYAACTKHEDHKFYIVCLWMSAADAKHFCKEIENDEKTFYFVEKDVTKLLSSPPTKMKHSGILKPFEMYLEMYGLPAYNEIDPTPLLALTYTIFFGFMFGDFGQGALLFLGGALLYKFKKSNLAGIISLCGVCSMVFGLLFGSVFGFEDVIEPLWLHPQTAMTTLPFIGRLNTVFVVAVAIGMGVILVCMAFNIANGIKQGNKGKMLLDTNGLVGMIFYGVIVAVIVLFMTGRKLPAGILLGLLIGVPLLLLFFKEPILAAAEHKEELIEGGVGMFITQGFFEMFETLLSFFSNTLSFVRVGAFAVSHAAMMGVVLMLAGAENGGNPNWLVIVLGNLFVCGMEGLIVGIQVLRLEYYELFSRFYSGTGKAFKPYGKKKAA